jgi:hypothetical protein
MTIPITLVLMQQGLTRPQGYQVVNWMAFAPEVPTGISPPPPAVATSPLSYAPLFLMRNTVGVESFERVATDQDFVTYPVPDPSNPQFGNELQYFEALGTNGGALLANALPNDQLQFTDPSLNIWLQDNPAFPPYANNNFVVNGVVVRNFINSSGQVVPATGTAPLVDTSGNLTLPGYTFTPFDVGRWVLLTGFVMNASYNGWQQIVGINGSMGVLGIPTPGLETGGTWTFKQIQIKPFPLDPPPPPYLHDPRYFPTKVSNAPWTLVRGSSVITSNTSGGRTLRAIEGQVLFRSVRFTSIEPTLTAALNLMAAVRASVSALQQAASTDGTSFTVIIVTQFGP